MYLLLLFVIGVLYYSHYILLKNRKYWKNRNIPYVKPLPIFGNYKDCLLVKKHINLVVQNLCQQFPDEPYFGSFYGTSPALIIQDPNLIKLVLSKEFYFCNGRETSDYNDKEMFSKMMFFANGDEWKVLRMNSSQLFSSAKLKKMFYLINDSSDTLERLLADEIKTGPDIEVKNLLSRYTMDCITTCAFGFNSETMKQDVHKNPFTTMAEKIFDRTVSGALKNYCRSMWPRLFYALGFKLLEDDAGTFFNNVITEVLRQRGEAKSSRNDFVDLILTWKTDKYISGDRLNNAATGGKKKVRFEVNDDLIVAQCVLFFAAGFETTSTTLSFLLYELAKNKMVQEKMIAEVDEYFSKHQSIEYECINTMPYTESCIEECLRLYPALGLLTREVMHDYSLPTGVRLKRGDRIHIPVYHIQRNPDHFPEPEVYRPERFFGDEKKNIKPYTHMPFGEGPRICIGKRFAKMPMHAALLKIFKNYRVELAESMQHEISLNAKSLIMQSVGGIHIKFIQRQV
ncbi:cytochrome P450 6B5-like [Maniola jurtina]|uniref:cytochrome P450 6B5-like n=1 Tax=Maniola jurtina TaxID=191418 RepID=UPI001E6896AE|nr:cytochrome P450 6B5-like [Maniola jurtina]